MLRQRFSATIQKLATGLLVAAVGFLAIASLARPVSARPHHQSVADPFVLAFYYTWFDEGTWTADQLSDLPAQPYVSRDRAVMGRHIDQAKAAGIDAFLVAWYGPGGGNQTDSNLAALLEEAAVRDFRIGVLFETNSPFFTGSGDVTAALQHLNAVHANHPAYLKADGRPVVFFWRPTIYGIATWRDIRNQADSAYQNIWISEGVDTSFLQVFDGHHLYSNTWNPPANLDATNGKFAGLVSAAAERFGTPKLWVATVMPGYNDTRIRPSGFAHDRAGGGYFAQSWQSAIDSRPNWIVINSFNEWPEGTYIEPSAAYGDQYLGLVATWSRAFKGHADPVVQTASFSAVPPAPTPLPELAVPTAFVDVVLLNLRAGPGTDFEIVGQAAQGAQLPIIGVDASYPDWYHVSSSPSPAESRRAWVYAPLVKAAGPLEQIGRAEAPSAPSTARSFTPNPSYAHTWLRSDPVRRALTPRRSP